MLSCSNFLKFSLFSHYLEVNVQVFLLNLYEKELIQKIRSISSPSSHFIYQYLIRDSNLLNRKLKNQSIEESDLEKQMSQMRNYYRKIKIIYFYLSCIRH